MFRRFMLGGLEKVTVENEGHPIPKKEEGVSRIETPSSFLCNESFYAGLSSLSKEG